MTQYQLSSVDNAHTPSTFLTGIKRLIPLLLHERKRLIVTLVAVVITTGTTLSAPIIISHVIDGVIVPKDEALLLPWTVFLLSLYLLGLGASYIQTMNMGHTGRRVLFDLRNTLFTQVQRLPIAFFHQNKAGDLISRINNDTDKLNQFFAQALIQLIGNTALMLGTGIIVLSLSWSLGLVALAPAFVAIILTQIISPWVRTVTFRSLQTLGTVSGEIQESINNFKVIIAFDRLDYFRSSFDTVNKANFKASVVSGIATNIFTPLYGLAYNAALIAVVFYGISLIEHGALSVGLLIGFVLYVTNFYTPLRQVAASWSSMQTALAGLDRVSEVLDLRSDMSEGSNGSPVTDSAPLVSFEAVSFAYSEGSNVLNAISFTLEEGKTYAFVGPTGGGKSTTASLMTRLYDPTQGSIRMMGRDLKDFTDAERAEYVGFITQEPFLFSGTVFDNIVYANQRLSNISHDELEQELRTRGLAPLLERFPQGLDTKVSSTDETISLGQKQLVAFVRTVLRTPRLLILDEATANIDTVTEELLDAILASLPASTTIVVIAHRLNTIARADQIFFVNGGSIENAGSLQHAVELLLSSKRAS